MTTIDDAIETALPERYCGGCDRPVQARNVDEDGCCCQCGATVAFIASLRPAVRAAFVELLKPLRGWDGRLKVRHSHECMSTPINPCSCNLNAREDALLALIAEANHD